MPRRPVTPEQHAAILEYRKRERVKAGNNSVGHRVHAATAKTWEYAARVAEIPPDNRSYTGIFFGDPLPHDPRRRVNG